MIQQKVHHLILGRLRASGRLTVEEDNFMPWLLLETIMKTSYDKFFKLVIYNWGKTDMARADIISVAKSHISGPHNEQVCM